MPVTRQLLTRLRSLDDLIELAAELGYAPHAQELNGSAQRRLGLDVPALGTRRAAIVGRAGGVSVYGIVAGDTGPGPVAAGATRLARATAGDQHLLLALDTAATTLVCATARPGDGPTPVRQRWIRR